MVSSILIDMRVGISDFHNTDGPIAFHRSQYRSISAHKLWRSHGMGCCVQWRGVHQCITNSFRPTACTAQHLCYSLPLKQ